MFHPSRVGVGLLSCCLVLTACGASATQTTNLDAPSVTSAAPSVAAGDDTPPAATTSPIPTAARPADTVPDPGPAPTSGAAVDEPTASTSPTSATPDCRRLTEFDGGAGDWIVVNDGVMGGRSDGRLEIADSEMRFTGEVVTRGGGFTSVRRTLDGDELDGTERIVMRVRADGRTYGLTMEDSAGSGRRPISHRADLTIDPVESTDGWSIATLPYTELEPQIFGQPIDADAFDPDSATEIGIIIADGQDGAFALVVDWIDACR